MLLGAKEAGKILSEIRERVLCSSTLLLLEAERNLLRLFRDKLLDLDQYDQALRQLRDDKSGFLLMDLSLDLTLTGTFPPARMPKTSDLAHIRTALWFNTNGGLVDFISLDRSQLLAAREMGVPGRWEIT